MAITWDDVMKFQLPENPIIFDIGGFKGDWVEIAIKRYKNPTIYVFEPVTKFYNIIIERWKNNPNIKVFNFGLSDKNRDETISIDEDSSSVYKKNKNSENIKLRDIREFLFDEGIFHIDLAKINIEGEEYRLMEYLTSHPELNIIENYLIRFHTFINNYDEKRNNIIKTLSKYYNCNFNYEYVFEGWTMKKIQKINCFGDSHISIFANVKDLVTEKQFYFNDPFNVYRFGPHLAYNLLNKTDVLETINKIDTNENLLLCFGEIDCRAQIKKICDDTDRDYKNVINEVISNYFSLIDKINNKNIILFSITPELKEKPHWYYYEENPEVFDCPRGSLIERQTFKKYFNENIKIESEKRNYKYISIFDYISDNNKTNEIYYLDDIHLKPNNVFYLIKREMIKNNLLL